MNIPLSELSSRVHELPPRDQALGVVGPAALVREVLEWLVERDRRGVAVETPPELTEAEETALGYLWEPNGLLADVLPQLPCGDALELACGTGRDAVYMSSCGWNVTAVDKLPDALARGRDLAARYAPALRPIRWLECDLETAEPRFDRTFDLIAVFRYLHRPLFPLMRRWLRSGASVLCETFTTMHRERYGRPSRAAHVLELGELPELLSGFEIRHYSEEWRGRAHTARIWARIA